MKRSALDLLEDSLSLLLAQGSGAWLRYLAGQVPLLLCLLYFAEDMASGYRADRCLIDSFLVTTCFFWAAFWRSRFSGMLLASVVDDQSARKPSGAWQCLSMQIVLQSAKLLVLPLAVLSILPLPWVSAFFRGSTVDSDRNGSSLGVVIRRSAARASASNTTYWIGILILTLLGLILFINIVIAGALLPQLAKSFTGYETSWTRNFNGILNFNLLAIGAAATWFLLDPLSQAFSVLNCFHFEARSNGQDLSRDLRRLAGGALLFLVLIAPARPETSQTISVEDLNRGVETALTQPDFQWRTPLSAQRRSPFADRIYRDIRRLAQPVRAALTGLGGWLRKLFRQNPSPTGEGPTRSHPPGKLYLLLYAAGALVVLVVLITFVRGRSRRAKPVGSTSSAELGAFDPSREDVLATELPDDEWLRLARQYTEGGEYRSAVRALYLSTLAHLGSHRLISVARSKTNGAYERELQMRAPAPELFSTFAAVNLSFEKAWYGSYPVDAETAAQSERHTQIIRQLCLANDRASLHS